ncbi:collagen alpha-1(I) chain-like [Lontra canadensis]|uniref:collagen alpha-1(I) chain-like n=1 Tax=Lontra canadensis TaxID=76717 RepID=UPI0013F2E685|nr:collagen alpha-1(I) chain-like [Lontra canadensis]
MPLWVRPAAAAGPLTLRARPGSGKQSARAGSTGPGGPLAPGCPQQGARTHAFPGSAGARARAGWEDSGAERGTAQELGAARQAGTQEAGGGSGSAEAGTTAVPASRDREVTTHSRLDSPRRVTGRWPAVHRPPGLRARVAVEPPGAAAQSNYDAPEATAPSLGDSVVGARGGELRRCEACHGSRNGG